MTNYPQGGVDPSRKPIKYWWAPSLQSYLRNGCN